MLAPDYVLELHLGALDVGHEPPDVDVANPARHQPENWHPGARTLMCMWTVGRSHNAVDDGEATIGEERVVQALLVDGLNVKHTRSRGRCARERG